MAGFPNTWFPEREAWNSQVSENSARGALAWGTAQTSGSGELLIEDPIIFDVTFIEQPIVMYGFAIDDDEKLIEGRFPRVSGGVYRWIRDERDFYVGAHVYVTVATADPILAAQSTNVPADFATDPGYDLTHSFTFSGVAMKEISP